MNRLCKLIIGVVALFISISPIAYADIQSNEEAIKELEIKINEYDRIISDYDFKSKELKNKLDENKNELIGKFNDLKKEWSDEIIVLGSKEESVDREVDKLENNLNWIKKILVWLGLGSFAGVFYGIEKVREYIKKKVANEFQIEKDNLIGVAKEYEKEIIRMRNKKIAVISLNNEEKLKVENVLKNFPNKGFVLLPNDDNQEDNLNLDEYDLILFNNLNGVLLVNSIKKIIRTHNHDNKKVFLYYNTSNKRLDQNETENLNFATNKATLHSNLMNLLKYQDDVL